MGNEPYNNVVALSQTCEISLFKNQYCQVSWFIGINRSRLRPLMCLLDTDADRNLFQGEVLDPSSRESIRKCDMPNIRSVSDTKLKVSVAITLHLHMAESCTPVTLAVVNELIVLPLLGTTYIDRFIKSINPTERKFVPRHSPPVQMLMVH